jgi:hypothetical protein
MKKFVIFCLGLIFLFSNAKAQDTTAPVKLYESWYYYKNHDKHDRSADIYGYTYQLNDTSISLVPKKKYVRHKLVKNENLINLPIENIGKIKFQRRGRKYIMLVTGLTGAVIGGFIGEKASRGSDVKVAFFMSIFAGGGLGIIIGLPFSRMKKVVKINGNVEKYKEYQPKLRKYSIVHYYTH